MTPIRTHKRASTSVARAVCPTTSPSVIQTPTVAKTNGSAIRKKIDALTTSLTDGPGARGSCCGSWGAGNGDLGMVALVAPGRVDHVARNPVPLAGGAHLACNALQPGATPRNR